MTSDLTEATLLQRTALILDDQHLIFAAHSGTTAELRRIPYRSVSRLTVHRKPLTVRVVLLSLLAALGGGLLLLTGDPVGYVIAGIYLMIVGAAAAHYAVAGRTFLTFEHGRQTRICKVIARPKRIERFLHRFGTAVQAAQEHERARRTEAEA